MGDDIIDGSFGIDVVKEFGVFLMKFKWIDVVLIVFGLFLAYQIIKYLLGGSWAVDALSLGMLFLIIGILWKMNVDVLKMGMKLDGHFKWHDRDGR